MAIKRMEHVGIVVDDLAAAIEFFVELGLEPGGAGQVEGEWVDRIIALDGTKAELAMLRTPDGHGEIELVKFHSPPTQGGNPHAPSNTPGLRHLSFLVEDIDALVAGRKPAALSSSASWCATRTATASATSGAPRESSSSWQRSSADGSGPPAAPDRATRSRSNAVQTRRAARDQPDSGLVDWKAKRFVHIGSEA
jgi:catechol 2,3-dioxygenase-like lactoylglutathione lyase family enzyme